MIDRYRPFGTAMIRDNDGQWLSYTDHIAEVCKLRDKLMEICKECSECAGNGVVTVHYEYNDQAIDRVEDCPSCLDIRSVLA